MTSNCTQFQHITLVQNLIHITNGATIMAEDKSNIILSLTVKGVKNLVILKQALYVPAIGSGGLVSVRWIQAAGAVVSFTENTISIWNGEKLYSITKLEQNTYILQTKYSNIEPEPAQVPIKHGILQDWHCHLGHISFDNVKHLANHYPEITIDGSYSNSTCVSSIAIKPTCIPNHLPSTRITIAPLELIYTDLAGPMRIPLLKSVYYFFLFIDDHTRYTLVFTIHQKAETFSKFQKYKVLVENYHTKKIKAFWNNNGKEYTSDIFSTYLATMVFLMRRLLHIHWRKIELAKRPTGLL